MENFLQGIDGHDDLKQSYSNFIEDGKVNICFYVLWGDKCSYRFLLNEHRNAFHRMPNEIEYKIVEINVTENEEFVLGSFLIGQCGKNYDYTGALTYFVPFRHSSDTYDSYFCSQLMVCALQQINKLGGVNPSGVTPNELHRLLLTSL
jgi:hypothetical protein